MTSASSQVLTSIAGMVLSMVANHTMAETFIMPTGANKPSFVKRPRQRARLEWFRLKKRIADFGG